MVAPNGNQLSEREKEILRLVATGASNKEIAAQLIISPNTVKVHLRNIFAKIGVASRTEATLYAIRAGLAQNPVTIPLSQPPAQAEAKLPPQQPEQPAFSARPRLVWAALLGSALLLVLSVGVWQVMAPSDASLPVTTALPSESTPWEVQAPLPNARAGLAAAVYNDRIYAIAGETVTGITGQLDCYDPIADQWTTLAPKPLPVTDIGAVLIGGRIYVPGGKLADGSVSDRLEVYDPQSDLWSEKARLPKALSAYAAVAFEGKLYLFGGWDGQQYVADVYAYNPDQDRWNRLTPLSAPRGHAGAAVAAGRIHLLGGTDGRQALATHQVYSLAAEDGTAAWKDLPPLPSGRHSFAITAVAEIIYLVGGTGGEDGGRPLAFLPKDQEWQQLSTSGAVDPWPARSALGVIANRLHVFGGANATGPLATHRSYQAVYAVLLPLIIK